MPKLRFLGLRPDIVRLQGGETEIREQECFVPFQFIGGFSNHPVRKQLDIYNVMCSRDPFLIPFQVLYMLCTKRGLGQSVDCPEIGRT